MKEPRHIRVMLALMLLMWITCSILLGEFVYRGLSSKSWRKIDGIYMADGSIPFAVKYQYAVNGKTYHGTRHSFNLSSRKPYTSMRTGHPVTVHIHPEHPQSTVLETGTDALSVTLLSFSTLAALLSAGALRRQVRNGVCPPR